MRALMHIFSRTEGNPAKGKAAPRRRTTRARPPRWYLRKRLGLVLLLTAVAVAGLVTGAWQLKQSGVVQGLAAAAYMDLVRWSERQIVRAGLTVQHVFVTGRGETSKGQVLRAVGVRSGQSILAFDPDQARQRLLNLGWVKTARVERRLPDTIVVRISERKALALWQHKGRHVLIDHGGKVITRKNLARFAHLPVVVGKDAPLAAAALIEMLSRKPTLFAQVQAAVRIGARRWDVRLKNGIKVHLPEDDPFSAWHRLAELVAEHRIFERDVAAIDLRLPDRLVLRLTPEAAAKKNKAGKDT
ncbi:MAG: FtsQ-type POTRA domain-containing protein [Alphaproteobacteria bacterium]|nr:FtsQ-type POTRA domain-containing protein [Alphaproteobacteria bacterium]